MYPSTTNITELANYISHLENLPYRFMAQRMQDEFKVTRLIIGPKALWSQYEYKNVIFIAGVEYGPTVANWLLDGKITLRFYKKYEFPITPMRNDVTSSRHPSHSQAGSFIISKPFTMYKISFSESVTGRDYELTSEDAPFFLTLWEAEHNLLYDIPEDKIHSGTQVPEAAVYVYLEHSEAWLEEIHFSLATLDVHLAGSSWQGTKLKISGSEIQQYDDHPQQNIVSIPLPNGRPDYLKIVLLRDGTWIDYFIDEKNYRSNPVNPKRTNVTFAEPEPKEQIRELIDRGEGKHIEFKAVISFSSDKLKWLKTVAAFANGEGGSLILGVNDENGVVVGIDSMLQKYQNSVSKFKDAITLAISDTIEPAPEYEFVHAHIDNHDVLAINVSANSTQCYAIYQNKEVPVYYIRRGATTRIADTNEVQELVKMKSTYLFVPPFNPIS